jgi:hypothetical protein
MEDPSICGHPQRERHHETSTQVGNVIQTQKCGHRVKVTVQKYPLQCESGSRNELDFQ